jgi:quercetin dioxygenase-like cupin family protein
MVIAVIAAWAIATARAQDPLAVAPEMYRLLFENERVRVMEVSFQPGQKIAAHSHPDHYVYVAEAGTLRIFKPDGTSTDVTVNVGDVVWIAAETHWAENIGATPVRLVVNEIKEPAAAAAVPSAP